MKEQHIHNREVLKKDFEPILCRLNALLNTGKPMRCADGWMREY